MPTQPASTPTSKAEPSIKTSASVTLLTSPRTTHAKPCEHVGRVLLFTSCRQGEFSETELPVFSVLGNLASGVQCSRKLRGHNDLLALLLKQHFYQPVEVRLSCIEVGAQLTSFADGYRPLLA